MSLSSRPLTKYYAVCKSIYTLNFEAYSYAAQFRLCAALEKFFRLAENEASDGSIGS